MVLLKHKKLTDEAALQAPLRAAIERAYATFAISRVDFTLGVCHCNCCCTEANERALIDTPLREVSSDLLSEYTNSAHGYDEPADGHVLRYFLPRYFELIALNDPPHYGDLWHCLSRLGQANYRRNWSQAEIEAIDVYFDALLSDKLADVGLDQWPVGRRLSYPITDLLEMMLRAGADVERLVSAWSSSQDPGASVHAADLVVYVVPHEGLPTLDRGPEHGRDTPWSLEVRRALGTFLASPQMVTRMERAFFALDGPRALHAILSDGQAHAGSVLQTCSDVMTRANGA